MTCYWNCNRLHLLSALAIHPLIVYNGRWLVEEARICDKGASTVSASRVFTI